MTGALISRGLMLVATMMVARVLGKKVYGELGIIEATVSMFTVFAGFGLGVTATKHVAEFRKKDPQRAGRIIGIAWLTAAVTGGLTALGFASLAPWLAAQTLNAPHLSSVLRIAAIILFVSALNATQTGTLAGFEAFRTIARVNLFAGLLAFPILLASAYVGGLVGAVWAMVINVAFNWLANHVALRREAAKHGVPLRFKRCLQELPVLWRFSLPAVLCSSMLTPVSWACGSMLVRRAAGYEEMAILTAATQWYAVIHFLPSLVSSVLMPMMSDQVAQQDVRKSAKLLLLGVGLNVAIVTPLAAIAIAFSPRIMRLYGETFGTGWPVLVIVLLTAIIHTAQTPVGNLIAASGRMWMGFAMNAGWGVTFLGCSFLWVENGAEGIAAARCVAYVAHGLWTTAFAAWILRQGRVKELSLVSRICR